MRNFFTDRLGIGIGRIHIHLESDRVRWGQTLRGELRLELPEPLEAERILIGIRARQRSVRHARKSSTTTTSNAILYDVHKEIRGRGRFDSSRLPFAIPLPARPGSLRDVHPTLSDVVTVANALRGNFHAEPTWVVYGRLARPWKMPLRHNVAIFPRD